MKNCQINTTLLSAHSALTNVVQTPHEMRFGGLRTWQSDQSLPWLQAVSQNHYAALMSTSVLVRSLSCSTGFQVFLLDSVSRVNFNTLLIKVLLLNYNLKVVNRQWISNSERISLLSKRTWLFERDSSMPTWHERMGTYFQEADIASSHSKSGDCSTSPSALVESLNTFM